MKITFITQLIARYKEKTATPAERYVLERWYDSFDINGKDAPWLDDPDYLKSFQEKALSRIETRPLRRKWQRTPWIRVAAAILLIGSIATALYLRSNREPQERHAEHHSYEFATSAGQTKRVVLSDSTEIFLNANSTLRLAGNFGRENRNVYLIGEALFNVKHDHTRPFIVHTESLVVRVLGTSFNVNAYGSLNQVRIGVEKGRVAVSHEEAAIGKLIAGDQLSFDRRNGQYELRSGVPVDRAWVNGKVQLANADFAELCQVFHNTYGVHLKSDDPAVQNGRFNLTVNRARPLAEAVEKLCTLIGKQHRKEGTDRIIIQ
ncbi:FecR family protein [Parapedobacter sp. GCM10030251]|uniref:FecR family protein n=1 Tax=Parapedobacter sp. GCM10030251 TaxID=3273419 RepID=UPI003616E27F